MNKFTEKAKKVLGGSEVIAGLEKVENDLLIATYPDAMQFSAALRQEGGIKVKLSKKKSRSNGQPYTAVEIVD